MKSLKLTCSCCGSKRAYQYEAKCSCGGTLLVTYDPEQVLQTMTKKGMFTREASMWRYHELLPIQDKRHIVSLGEGWTPLLYMKNLGEEIGLDRLWIKREEQNPTGSFKSRGFSAAVSILKERGVVRAAVPSNGNAASALAAYAARAGMESVVIVPMDCPGLIVAECEHYGAKTFRIDGYIHDAGRMLDEGAEAFQWTNVGTLREPGRVEGKKTMGLELAEQFDWSLPDVIVYPTGGGSGIIGMWKAFKELQTLGWITDPLPRLICVQEDGCDPIAQHFNRAQARSHDPQHIEPTSSPTGMRVPQPPDLPLLLRILRETNGAAVTVTSKEIRAAQNQLGLHGLSASPEGAATLAGCKQLVEAGNIHKKERVVLFNTSHAQKYVSHTANAPIVSSYAELKAHLLS
ncbi:threonine synthase [Marinicrinis sediminis]|uniref:Threonine synthase n=1 Tax=Marinicrinis sediminis TaxID=1652465 RepID=A0ABW5R837_9BACL